MSKSFYILICFFFFILNFSYSQSSHCESSSYIKNIPNNQLANYTTVLNKITKSRDSLAHLYKTTDSELEKKAIIAKAGILFQNSLLYSVFPYWYGTKWDFNGYSEIPREGTIACGYFLSTTLRHAGLPINRYKLAQQTPQNEAKSLASGAKVIELGDVSNKEMLEYFKANCTEGIYFVGLFNHVGFLLYSNNQLYFIHSNYIGTSGVTLECTKYSLAFHGPVYYIVPLSTNEIFIKKWLLQGTILIVAD
jgi:hypothetical protein